MEPNRVGFCDDTNHISVENYEDLVAYLVQTTVDCSRALVQILGLVCSLYDVGNKQALLTVVFATKDELKDVKESVVLGLPLVKISDKDGEDVGISSHYGREIIAQTSKKVWFMVQLAIFYELSSRNETDELENHGHVKNLLLRELIGDSSVIRIGLSLMGVLEVGFTEIEMIIVIHLHPSITVALQAKQPTQQLFICIF